MSTSLVDVLIAGAGPVGLLLACELRHAGVSVRLLDKAEHPHSPLKSLPFGLRGLNAPSLDALRRRGLLDELVAAQRSDLASGATHASAHWMQASRHPAGHFAALPFFRDDVDVSSWPQTLRSAEAVNLAVSLQSLEDVLATRALAMGAQIHRGVAVGSFEETRDGVTVRAGGTSFAARWLVGCDGGRSTVRKLAAFGFVGTEPEFTGYSIDADLSGAEDLRVGRNYTDTGIYTYARPGTIALVDFDGGAFHRSEAITGEHVQTLLRRISGTHVTLDALRLATTWTDRAYQATAYRRGRVLLAGDAAHIHSPLGGQGLNLGLGDAMDLGWKLAATIRGDAPPGLIDSYFEQRHPAGARVLEWSRAQVALMRPDRGTRALADIMRDLLQTRDGATYFAERAWGVRGLVAEGESTG